MCQSARHCGFSPAAPSCDAPPQANLHLDQIWGPQQTNRTWDELSGDHHHNHEHVHADGLVHLQHSWREGPELVPKHAA